MVKIQNSSCHWVQERINHMELYIKVLEEFDTNVSMSGYVPEDEYEAGPQFQTKTKLKGVILFEIPVNSP